MGEENKSSGSGFTRSVVAGCTIRRQISPPLELCANYLGTIEFIDEPLPNTIRIYTNT